MLGGATAVVAGLLDQGSDPPSPARSTAPSPAAPPSAAPSPSAAVSGGAPVHLRIPTIGVDGPLIRVGLRADGTLEVPQPGPDYDKAAWYDGSPAPGDIGPAVIEGHVDSAAAGPSVFYELGALTVGDTVDVTRDDGSIVTFVVYDVQRFAKDDFPRLAVYGNTLGAELRLITCGGDFDDVTGHYVDNTVVFAHIVGP